MCRNGGAGEPGPSMRFFVVAVLACALVGARCPRGRGLQQRPLRHPGRRLARPRAPGTLERAAGPARAPRRRARALQPALGPDRGRRADEPDWEDSDAVLEGLHDARHPRRRRPRRLAALGERGQDAELRTGRGHRSPTSRAPPRRATAGCSEWLIWNEPNQARWLRPTTRGGLRPPDPQPRLRRASTRSSRAPRWAAVSRRRAASAGGVSPVDLDPRDARRRGPPRCLRAPPVSVEHPRDAVRRAAASHCTTITMATLERLLSEVEAAPSGRSGSG